MMEVFHSSATSYTHIAIYQTSKTNPLKANPSALIHYTYPQNDERITSRTLPGAAFGVAGIRTG
jgi:hypothetical protein